MPDNMTEREESPFSSRRFIVAAVVVGFIALLGIGLAVSNLVAPSRSTERAAEPTSSSAGEPSSATSSRAAEASICGLSAEAETGTIERAPEAEWTLVGTVAAPESAQLGPGVREESGYRHCFARTPEGAAFAAANFVAMGSAPSLALDVARGSVMPGAGRDALLGRGRPTDSGGGTRIQIAGVRVLSYSARKAQIDVAVRTSNGALGAQVFDLVWDGGDWKMEVTANGELLTQAAQIRDLGGYVLWSGA